jgi:hypothetical protein
MARQMGGFSLEGRYFIVEVPDEWKEMEPLPKPGPTDLWFDHVTEFKAALRGPWIRWPVRRSVWSKRTRATKPASSLRCPSRSSPPVLAETARSSAEEARHATVAAKADRRSAQREPRADAISRGCVHDPSPLQIHGPDDVP